MQSVRKTVTRRLNMAERAEGFKLLSTYTPDFKSWSERFLTTTGLNTVAAPLRLAIGEDPSKTDSTGRLLYALGGTGLQIFEASSQEPVPVGPQVQMEGMLNSSSGGGLCISGKHLFVAAGEYLAVLDVTDPAAPRELVRTDTGVQPWTGDVAVLDQHAYVVGDGGLATFDIADPAAPNRLFPAAGKGQSLTKTIVKEALDLTAFAGSKRLLVRRSSSGVHAFVVTSTFLVVYDVSSPAEPKQVNPKRQKNKVGAVFKDQMDPWARAALAFVGDSHLLITGKCGIAIWNVADPAQPTLVAVNKYQGEGGAPTKFLVPETQGTDVVVRGGFAFLTSYRWGLTVYDVSEPTQPAFVAARKIDIKGNLMDHAVAVEGGKAYVVTDTGLATFDVPDPAAWPREQLSSGGCCEIM
jgi:hypothetical protein